MNKKIIIPANTLKKGDTIEIKTEMFIWNTIIRQP
jgi:hypothetical protein